MYIGKANPTDTSIGQSREDYLEAILLIAGEKGICRNVDIANRLSYAKPSVTAALKKLHDEGYVRIDDNNFVTLTDAGRAVAEGVYTRHRFIAGLLTRIGVTGDVAERDACLIEHCISEESFDKLVEWYSKETGNAAD